jgi:hypothetical protein
MNRANKSRVVFKIEPFTVNPRGEERPNLVRTARFSQDSLKEGQTQASPVEEYPMNFHGMTDPVKPPQVSRVEQCPPNPPSMPFVTSQAWEAWGSSKPEATGSGDGSLSLDCLAKMEPLLDQKSRSDAASLASDLDF